MNSIENGKVKRIQCNCKCCIEYLKTNPLCRLGRDTSKTKYCKWYYAGKNTSNKQKKTKQPKVKTMQEVIDSINKTIEAKKAKQEHNWNNKIGRCK